MKPASREGAVMTDKPIVEEIWSADRRRKAVIVRRDDGLFQVWLHREVAGDGEFEPESYWSPIGHDAILTDTLDRARSVAEGELGPLKP